MSDYSGDHTPRGITLDMTENSLIGFPEDPQQLAHGEKIV